MTLHRRIIRSLSSADDPQLRFICRQAAHARLTSAMDFVSGLRPEHLQSFWYSASKYNFALVGTFISLLWATSTEKDEAGVYKKSLDEYRWVLRLSSKSAEFLERAIGMLASSTGVLIKGIPEQPDAERVLDRALRGVRRDWRNRPGLYRHGSSIASMTYLSEPELREDKSPENMVGDTPSESGLLGTGWNIDNTWFSALGDVSGGFERHVEGSVSNLCLAVCDEQGEFDFAQ